MFKKLLHVRGLFLYIECELIVSNPWAIRFSHFSKAKMQGFGTLTNLTVQVPLLKSFSVCDAVT